MNKVWLAEGYFSGLLQNAVCLQLIKTCLCNLNKSPSFVYPVSYYQRQFFDVNGINSYSLRVTFKFVHLFKKNA